MHWLEIREDHLVVNLRVTPRAGRDGVHGLVGDALKVRIQTPPVDGKANTQLLRYLSKRWNVPRASMEIASGETGRNKRLRINNPSEPAINKIKSEADSST